MGYLRYPCRKLSAMVEKSKLVELSPFGDNKAKRGRC